MKMAHLLLRRCVSRNKRGIDHEDINGNAGQRIQNQDAGGALGTADFAELRLGKHYNLPLELSRSRRLWLRRTMEALLRNRRVSGIDMGLQPRRCHRQCRSSVAAILEEISCGTLLRSWASRHQAAHDLQLLDLAQEVLCAGTGSPPIATGPSRF